MKPYPWPAAIPPEDLGDPVLIVVHGSIPGRIRIETAHASPEQRRALGPCLAFLRRLRKPPGPERISITLADPTLMGLLLTGRLSLGSLDMVERVVGLHTILPDDRWGQSGAAAAWLAHFHDRLRVRLRIARPQPARQQIPRT